ncbi:hypothetical protein BGW80DRAFT_289690 [Lactifluus volemus]|nr:hypothetical protein BGW80DRAFT_289690 [Lactifluus volemus]
MPHLIDLIWFRLFSVVLMTLVVHYGFLVLFFALVKSPVTRTAVRSGNVAQAQPASEEQDINIDHPPTVFLRRLFRITLMLTKGCALQFIVLFCIRLLILGGLVDFLVPFLLARLGSIFEESIYLLCLLGYVGLRFRINGYWLSALRDNIRAIHTDYRFDNETIRHLNCKEHKSERYRASVRKYQKLRYRVIMGLNPFNLVQNLVITVGLLIVSMTGAQGVRAANGQLEPRNLPSFAVRHLVRDNSTTLDICVAL